MAENVTLTRGKPVEDKANCSPFDLGVLFEELHQFSDQQKFELINNVWRPGSTFLFPKTKESGRNRRFNSSWLQDFPWLVYSRYLDGAFCLPCVLFARQCGRNSAKLDKLVKSPLTFWTTAFNRLSNHANGKCSTHNLSVIAMNNFVRVMKQEVVPVDQQLNTILQQQIAKDRTIMAFGGEGVFLVLKWFYQFYTYFGSRVELVTKIPKSTPGFFVISRIIEGEVSNKSYQNLDYRQLFNKVEVACGGYLPSHKVVR